jgi:nitrogen regulatory protein PII
MKLVTALVSMQLIDDLFHALSFLDSDNIIIGDVLVHEENRSHIEAIVDRLHIFKNASQISMEIMVLPAQLNKVIDEVSRICKEKGSSCMLSVG